MKQIRTIYANKGDEEKYRKRMQALIDAMNASALYWLLSGLNQKTPSQMQKELEKRIRQWKRVFSKNAGIISKRFVLNTKKYIEANMRLAFAEKGISVCPRIPKNTIKAFEFENENLIKSIPEKYFSQVSTLAVLALLYGWDKAFLTNKIEIQHNRAIKRARLIADDQSHKLTEVFKLAICRGRWD